MAQNSADTGATSGNSGTKAEDVIIRQGDFEVTVLSDGFITIPEDILLHDAPSGLREATLSRLDAPNGMIRPKANIPLIRRQGENILVDIGGGHKYQSSDGELEGHLRGVGVEPAEITKVVVSHAHPDHIGGTLKRDGALRFPNAEYIVGQVEWDFWMDPDYRSNMPEALHVFARGSQRDLGAVRERVRMVRGGDEVVPGLRLMATPGHTPGHFSLEMSGGDGLIIAVDVANNEIASFEHPDWRFGYDTDPDQGVATRKQLLDRAARDRVKLLGFHWAYPGLGFAERRGQGFHFVPATT